MIGKTQDGFVVPPEEETSFCSDNLPETPGTPDVFRKKKKLKVFISFLKIAATKLIETHHLSMEQYLNIILIKN